MSTCLRPRPSRRRGWLAGGAALTALAPAGCSTAATATADDSFTTINVAAAENFCGSLAQQLGGALATVTGIINSPDADPHDYEPAAHVHVFAAA